MGKWQEYYGATLNGTKRITMVHDLKHASTIVQVYENMVFLILLC